MKKMVYVIFLCLVSFLSQAQEKSNIKDALQKNYQNISSWQADFTQETYVEALDKIVQKKGLIAVKKPGRLKIIYTADPKKTYTSNSKKLWVYSEENQEVLVFKKMSKLVAGEALDFLNGLGELDLQFEVLNYPKNEASKALITAKNLELLELVPRDTESVLDRIVLAVKPQTNQILEMTLFNESGNKTHYIFTNIVFNTNPPDSFFEFVKPKGVREVNQ
ncbi:MAG: hypothetical protein ACD_73C00141G0005 [uncultured bacterium]|nr:MAG: hypothetical protein ACD_73C00141G0005 [uncultured bacterium]